MTWLKKHFIIGIFILLMVIPIPVMYFITSGMNASVREKIEQRALSKGDLETLNKTPVTFPEPGGAAMPQMTLVNDNVLAAYTALVESQRNDANEVIQAALEHNRHGRGVITPALFPEPPLSEREVLPREFHDQLVASYAALLRGIGAGGPSDAEQIKIDLRRQEGQFRDRLLKATDDLTEAEQAELDQLLTQIRLSHYVDRAREITIYARPESLSVPGWNPASIPSLSQLFEWQWNYWIAEDILNAIGEANAGAGSVLDSPVKRILSLQAATYDVMHAASASGGRGNRAPGGSFAGGFGDETGAAGTTAEPTGTPANYAMEAPRNFSASFTGRVTNPLYDVRYAWVDLVVETDQIPLLMDTLAKQNFMTVIDISMAPLDPHDHLAAGFFYQSPKLSIIQLQLETVWLREWTRDFMPPSVRTALGVVLPPPPVTEPTM